MITNVKFEMEIDSGNAALVDAPGAEVARLLRQVANSVECWPGDYTFDLHDINGNAVGTAAMEIETDDDD